MRALLVPLLGLVACVSGATYPISVSATTPVVAKPPTCEFQVLSLRPAGDTYEEIATLSEGNGLTTKDPDRFKEIIHDDVCRVGGDVVVAEINGQGDFVRGIVLRARPAADAAKP